MNKGKIYAISISIITYVLFFHSVIFNFYTVFWGSDMKHKFYPARVYLYESIVNEGRFPFWTEKIYSGFPIYADIENAYLHPLNVLTTIFLGPILSYKVLHFAMYLIGSFGLYLFLRHKKVGLLGFTFSNLVFFFSYFFINHQIHQSLILSFYTFPLSLYLLDRLFETKRPKYTILSTLVLSSVFYWGHPQMFILYVLGMVLYVLGFYIDRATFKNIAKQMLTVGWFVAILILPQLIPSLVLNQKSLRSFDFENISANQGSMHPLMFTNLLFPTIFLDTENYQGEEINSDYSYVETYNYIGVTTFILFLLATLLLDNSRLRRFIFLTFFFYLGLSFSKFLPFLDLDYIPGFNLFRYWTRSTILFTFAVSIAVGMFVEKMFYQKFSKLTFNMKFLLTFLITFFSLLLINSNNALTVTIFNTFKTYIPQSYFFKEWILVSLVSLGASIVLVFFVRKYKGSVLIPPLIMFLLFLTFLDLRFFSKDLLDTRTDNIKDLERVNLTGDYSKKRIVTEVGEIENNESLYYDFWWPYGYSQFVTREYYSFFQENEIGKVTRPEEADLHSDKYPVYKDLGVTHLIKDDIELVLSNNKPDILEKDFNSDYTTKEEGNFEFDVISEEAQTVQTYVKEYPGWYLFINGKRSEMSNNGIFISFPLLEGTYNVKLIYYPIHFWLGLGSSILLLLLSLFVYRLLPKKSRNKKVLTYN